MTKWFQTTWDTLRTSLWLVPALMAAAGIALALLMLRVDAGHGAEDQIGSWWINSGDGEDARNLVSTLLTGTITMASMAFSVTVVALTLAAQAYGPRLIRIFRADRRTQVVLGIFALTMVYCLVVLHSIHGKAPMPEVPHAAVTVASLLALLSILSLLVFIQGVATLIVSDEVVHRVRRDVEQTVAALPQLEEAPPAPTTDLPADLKRTATRIVLPREGYVQAVDHEGLLAWAVERDVVVRLDFRAGDFVVDGDRRILVYPTVADESQARAEINRFIVSGDERTPTQDLEFAIRHLVEVAVRALSPGTNDPFTAMVALDRLRGSLSRLMGRALPSEILVDERGKPRVQRQVTTYDGLLDAAFHQIRQNASDKPAVLIHMLESIARIAEHTHLDEQRRALARHAHLIRAAALRDVPEPADREDIERSHTHAMNAITAAGSATFSNEPAP